MMVNALRHPVGLLLIRTNISFRAPNMARPMSGFGCGRRSRYPGAVVGRALDVKSHQTGLAKGGEEPFKAAFAPS